jgi:ATP-dependent exoDNAse (exonuclease V) beta subunit
MYVSLTRAKNDVSIYTDNKKKMIDQAIEEQPRSSTLDYPEPDQKEEKVIDQAMEKGSPEEIEKDVVEPSIEAPAQEEIPFKTEVSPEHRWLDKEESDISPFPDPFKKNIDENRKDHQFYPKPKKMDEIEKKLEQIRMRKSKEIRKEIDRGMDIDF